MLNSLTTPPFQISLAGNNFNEFNPEVFKYLPQLADLDLSDCDFSRLWTRKVAPKTFPSLKYLNVSNNVLNKLSPADFNVSVVKFLIITANTFSFYSTCRNWPSWTCLKIPCTATRTSSR